MRNPYTTGGWVRGHEHYGRERLLPHLLQSPNDAFWVIGNRRMGKTSLLRQLEFLTASGTDYVPLYWDLQGIASLGEMAEELLYVIEEEEARFRKLLVDVELLRNWDAVGIIRLLRRYARAADRTLLLLVDEAEAFLSLGQQDPRGLARLRKVLQSDRGLRVVMASTKLLSRLHDLNHDWQTSPFLFGFSLANLTGLGDEAITALIRQTQNKHQVHVEDGQVRQISQATNNHPYLAQVLCGRLFETDGTLRRLTDDDLALDTVLDGYFQNDFRWLSPGERQVLLSIARGHRTLAAVEADTGLAPAVAEKFLFSLGKLGQVVLRESGLSAGNAFLSRWLEQNLAELEERSHSGEVTDSITLALIREGQQQEIRFMLQQLNQLRANLGQLELQRANYGLQVPLDLLNQIRQVRLEIESLEQQLAMISPPGAAR